MYTCTVTCKVSDLVSVGLMNISDKAKMKMKESIVSLGNVKTNKLSFTLVPSSSSFVHANPSFHPLVASFPFYVIVASYPINYVASSLPFNLSGRCSFT